MELVNTLEAYPGPELRAVVQEYGCTCVVLCVCVCVVEGEIERTKLQKENIKEIRICAVWALEG